MALTVIPLKWGYGNVNFGSLNLFSGDKKLFLKIQINYLDDHGKDDNGDDDDDHE